MSRSRVSMKTPISGQRGEWACGVIWSAMPRIVCVLKTSCCGIPKSWTSRSVEPIIIIGLPRSGTTHLLNLIAADQRLRSLPYWESLEPIPDPHEKSGLDGVDPRHGSLPAGLRTTDRRDAAAQEHARHASKLMCMRRSRSRRWTSQAICLSGSPVLRAGVTIISPTTRRHTMRT